jgi:hypothetical protein
MQSDASDTPIDWDEPLYFDRIKSVPFENRLEPQVCSL